MESLVTYNIFSKIVLCSVAQVSELHVSDCAHILLFIWDLFGICIYGAAWSYNNAKQLQIVMYISYRLV